ADVIVVINPSTRGFAMSSGERQPRDHAVISNPPHGDENGSLFVPSALPSAACADGAANPSVSVSNTPWG
ncbi:hypothetical protein, partial [Nonomuraea sp. NPDC049607]|uniref:hypothetical protein n=1 Tax=Nonomuraea sp. NPDC049607 TaxID=3154732 RepID=UPI00343BAA51